MTVRSLAWVATFAVLMTFAIPWFLWGSTRVVAGLPIWLWWHIGWMMVAAIVFWVFSKRAWGLGVTTSSAARSDPGDYRSEWR